MNKKKQERIEISPSPLVIGQNDQNQLNKQLNFNPKCCGPKSSNISVLKKHQTKKN